MSKIQGESPRIIIGSRRGGMSSILEHQDIKYFDIPVLKIPKSQTQKTGYLHPAGVCKVTS